MDYQERVNKIKKWLGSGSINIFGRPFSGKDSQGRILSSIFGGSLLGGGEILRSSVMPERVLQYARTGKLIPSDEYIDIVLPYLSQPNLAHKPLFLSSVGRWIGEERGVIEALEAAEHPLKAVIYLDISNDESRIRWQNREINNDRSGRHDDTEELLDIRFAEFDSKTLPVINYYQEIGLLVRIDGKNTRDGVNNDIIEALYQLATTDSTSRLV